MILLIDNYDSFSYNVYQQVASITPDVRVIRNDAMTADEVGGLHPDKIILSPGPKYPSEAGICEAVIQKYYQDIPILGICLGHQAICEVFGAKIVHAKRLMHGKQSRVTIDNHAPIFKGLPEQIDVARYHSLIATDIPDCLDVIATDDLGEVMAVSHKTAPVIGLQFHPESILTPDGETIMQHFILG